MTRRRTATTLFVALCVVLVAAAVTLNIGWIIVNAPARAAARLRHPRLRPHHRRHHCLHGVPRARDPPQRAARRVHQRRHARAEDADRVDPPLSSKRCSRASVSESQRREFYRIMLADTERLQQTVEQVLKAGVAGQRLALQHRAPVDIAALAAEVLETARAAPSPVGRDDDAVDRHAIGRRLLVDGDADELRTVLSNLLDNAVKYSRDAVQVAVEVAAPSPDTVWVRVQRSRRRHPARAAQAHLQSLLPLPDARVQGQRHRPRPLHRAVDRQAAWRPRVRGQRGRGQGRDVHRGIAAISFGRNVRVMARILVVEDEHHLAQGLSLQSRSRRPRGRRGRRRRRGASDAARRARAVRRGDSRRHASRAATASRSRPSCGERATSSRS